MKTEFINNFNGGLNNVMHPTEIRDNELQTLENMEIHPSNISDTISYFALTSRNSYSRLHSDDLGITPRNLIEFTQQITGGNGIGTRFLVTGGFTGTNFNLRHLRDGQTTTTSLFSAASSDTGICALVPSLQYLFYTDGALVWRKWDGVTDSASGFTTVTKTGIEHKNRVWYGNDITNALPNRLRYSDIGAPETVISTSWIDVGARFDPIIALVDEIERLIIVKEKSVWALYVAANVGQSTLIRIDGYKGTQAPLGAIWDSTGSFFSTVDNGIQRTNGNKLQPHFLQLLNQLKGFQNSEAAFGWDDDQIYLATLNTSGSVRNDITYLYDLLGNKMFKHVWPIVVYCFNRGTFTFNGKFKALEDDGTNQFIIELDQVASVQESTISCLVRTKDWSFKDTQRIKKIESTVISTILPDNSTTLTVKIFTDQDDKGPMTLRETKTFTPTTAGFNRFLIRFNSNISFGRYVSFQFEYEQPGTVALKFAILNMAINYDTESRID